MCLFELVRVVSTFMRDIIKCVVPRRIRHQLIVLYDVGLFLYELHNSLLLLQSFYLNVLVS